MEPPLSSTVLPTDQVAQQSTRTPDYGELALVMSGVNAITKARSLIGSTEPATAAPGTIRGDLSSDTIKRADAEDRGLYNLVHAADSHDSARNEIELWFG